MGRKHSFYLILYVSFKHHTLIVLEKYNENLFRKKIHILELDLFRFIGMEGVLVIKHDHRYFSRGLGHMIKNLKGGPTWIFKEKIAIVQ